MEFVVPSAENRGKIILSKKIRRNYGGFKEVASSPPHICDNLATVSAKIILRLLENPSCFNYGLSGSQSRQGKQTDRHGPANFKLLFLMQLKDTDNLVSSWHLTTSFVSSVVFSSFLCVSATDHCAWSHVLGYHFHLDVCMCCSLCPLIECLMSASALRLD